MKDRFGRTLDYLRISVTDRCNLRLRYCMPPEGVAELPRETILWFEEIVDVARAAVGWAWPRSGSPAANRWYAAKSRISSGCSPRSKDSKTWP